MTRWVLECPSCKQEIIHSLIEKRTIADYFFDKKPDFPDGGLTVDCPNCHKRSVFENRELAYRAD
jgi:endogenous inhibitor of DNA gyrase (YacG/DUF329 family)